MLKHIHLFATFTSGDEAYLPRSLTLSSWASWYRGPGLRTDNILITVITNTAVLVPTVWIWCHLDWVTSWAWEEREIRGWGNTAYPLLQLSAEVWSVQSVTAVQWFTYFITWLSTSEKGIMHIHTYAWISALSLYAVPGTICIYWTASKNAGLHLPVGCGGGSMWGIFLYNQTTLTKGNFVF